MIKEKCDICGIEFDERYKLHALSPEYQCEGIKEVCRACEKRIDEVIRKVDQAMAPIRVSWVRRIIMRILERR